MTWGGPCALLPGAGRFARSCWNSTAAIASWLLTPRRFTAMANCSFTATVTAASGYSPRQVFASSSTLRRTTRPADLATAEPIQPMRGSVHRRTRGSLAALHQPNLPDAVGGIMVPGVYGRLVLGQFPLDQD